MWSGSWAAIWLGGNGRRSGVAQCPAKLFAGADVELGEDLAQMPFDGAGAEEQLGADLRIRQPVTCEPGDLHLLRGELVARPDRALAHGLTRRQQLATAALSERLHAHRGEPFVGGAQFLACVRAALLTPQPLAVQEVSADQRGAHASATEPLTRLAVEALARLAFAHQRS